MSLFRKAQAAEQPRDNSLKRTWSQAPRSETVALPDLYHKSPRLDPVDLIANAIAGAPIDLYDKDQYRKDPDNASALYKHDFYDLMENPSKMFPEMDGHTVLYTTATLVELLGEMFWVKLRVGNRITDILPFPPSWAIRTPTAGLPTFLFQPFGTTAGHTIEVEPRDVVWFKKPDMADPYGRGRGRTEAVGDELDTDEYAAKWQKNFFFNDATPPFWANLPGAGLADLTRLKDEWMQKVGSWLNAKKPAFTNAENMQVTKLGDSIREMDFVESRRFLRDTFLQHYSIPPELFGILESSNRATIDAAYYLFAKNVISHRLGFYERAITRQLIQVDYSPSLIAKMRFAVPEDEAFKLTVSNEGLARGTLTRAEWRRAMGYPVDKADDVYLVPFSLVEVPKGTPIGASEPAPEEAAIDIVEEDPEKGVLTVTEKSVDTRSELKAAHWKMTDARAREGEGTFRAKTRTFASAQAKRVKSAIGSDPKGYARALKSAFTGADEALMHAYAPAWMSTMVDGAKIGRGLLGMKASPSFELYNKAFEVWIKKNGLKRAKDINTTTFNELLDVLQKSLAEGIAEGESIAVLTERVFTAVDGVYDKMTEARAEAIARTETISTVNFGQNVVYEAEGVAKKEWLSTPDGFTRESHEMMDGTIVGIDESFNVPGFENTESDSMDYPGGGSVAGQNINCRCTILPVLER